MFFPRLASSFVFALYKISTPWSRAKSVSCAGTTIGYEYRKKVLPGLSLIAQWSLALSSFSQTGAPLLGPRSTFNPSSPHYRKYEPSVISSEIFPLCHRAPNNDRCYQSRYPAHIRKKRPKSGQHWCTYIEQQEV